MELPIKKRRAAAGGGTQQRRQQAGAAARIECGTRWLRAAGLESASKCVGISEGQGAVVLPKRSQDKTYHAERESLLS